jgi:hypothetical protein
MWRLPGYAVSMNKICKTSLQSAADLLKHTTAHIVVENNVEK